MLATARPCRHALEAQLRDLPQRYEMLLNENQQLRVRPSSAPCRTLPNHTQQHETPRTCVLCSYAVHARMHVYYARMRAACIRTRARYSSAHRWSCARRVRQQRGSARRGCRGSVAGSLGRTARPEARLRGLVRMRPERRTCRLPSRPSAVGAARSEFMFQCHRNLGPRGNVDPLATCARNMRARQAAPRMCPQAGLRHAPGAGTATEWAASSRPIWVGGFRPASVIPERGAPEAGRLQ